MAHVDRQPKAGGTRRYTDEVAAGFDLIRETEVDLDFDTIYGEFNGNIDDTNIRAGASIDYSKLDLHGRIVPGDLAADFHLPAGGVPVGGLPPGSYAPGSIDTPDLAPGAAWQFAHQVDTALTLPYNILNTSELTVCTITTSPASRGGRIFILGQLSGWLGAPAPELTWWSRLRLAGTQVGLTEIAAGATGGSMQVPFQANVVALTPGTAGSTGPIILTTQLSIAGGALIGTLVQTRSARLVAYELA